MLGGNQLKIGYLIKARDACFAVRVLTPISHINLLGHETKEELSELNTQCSKCRVLLEYHFFDPSPIFQCPKCHQIFPFSVKQWKEKVQEIMEWSDLIVMQRVTDLSHLKLIEKIQNEYKKPVVIESDDNYFEVPPSNPGYQYYKPRLKIVEEMYQIASAHTVTTPYLKKVVSQYHECVEVIPNSLDCDLIEAQPTLNHVNVMNKKNQHIPFEAYLDARKNKKVIGWGGSPTHGEDLKIIIPAIKRLLRRHEDEVLFAFCGYIHRELFELIPEKQLFLFGLVPMEIYYSLYQTIRFDVGIAPVAENNFNKAKSSLKILEYMNLNIFPVASQFETYSSSIHQGFLAENTEYGWLRALTCAMTQDENQKQARLRENHQFVRDHYDITHVVHQWISFFEKVLKQGVKVQ